MPTIEKQVLELAIEHIPAKEVAKGIVEILEHINNPDAEILCTCCNVALGIMDNRIVNKELTIGQKVTQYLKEHSTDSFDPDKIGRLADHFINEMVCQRMVEDWRKEKT